MVDSTHVTLELVTVHMSGDESGWITIDDRPREIDLLTLQGGITDTLADAELPVGTVDQIRLRVSGAAVFLTDGRSFPLDVPSGDTSGIKVFPTPPIEIVGDLTTDLLLDFDVSESFSAVPNSPTRVDEIETFHFHPVLRVANLSTAGSIEGTIFDDRGTDGDTTDDVALPSAAVTLRQGGVVVGSTASGADGAYVLMGLPAGAGTLSASATGFASDSASVTIIAANRAVLDLRLTPGTLRGGS
jgi:hypothetical protein